MKYKKNTKDFIDKFINLVELKKEETYKEVDNSLNIEAFTLDKVKEEIEKNITGIEKKYILKELKNWSGDYLELENNNFNFTIRKLSKYYDYEGKEYYLKTAYYQAVYYSYKNNPLRYSYKKNILKVVITLPLQVKYNSVFKEKKIEIKKRVTKYFFEFDCSKVYEEDILRIFEQELEEFTKD